MPIEKEYKIRRARPNGEIAEITIPNDWRKYHNIEFGDTCTLLAGNIVVVLPPRITAEREADVRKFLEEGYTCKKE